MISHATSTLKTMFKRGLAALIPTIVTVWIIKWFFAFFWNFSTRVNETILYPITKFFVEEDIAKKFAESKALNVAGFLLSILVVLVLGFLLMSLVGRRAWAATEKHLARIPIIRAIYPHVKQLTDFFLTREKMEFRHVCSIEYPRRGVWSLGFVTGPGLKTIEAKAGKHLVAVFIPSSPSPVTGYVIYVPSDEIIHLPLTAEQMLRITISGGVIPPMHEIPKRATCIHQEQSDNIKIDSPKDSS